MGAEGPQEVRHTSEYGVAVAGYLLADRRKLLVHGARSPPEQKEQLPRAMHVRANRMGRTVDGEAEDLSDYGCTADSTSSGQSSVCLADFRYGPAWHALVVASIFTMLLSMDSILSFTKYESELTVSEAMEIAKKKQKQKEREMRFELTAASNPNRDRDATEKLGDSFRSVMHQASVKNLENVGAAMGKQTEEAMMNVGKESLKRIGSVKEMGTGLGKEGMKRMSSVSGFLRSPSSRKTEEKE